MRIRWGLLLSVFAALLSLPALAATDPAGSAVDVLPAATGELEGTTIDLSDGSDVYMGQEIVTGPNGQVQIIFKDDTHLVVGPNSSLLIAEYLMRNDTSASKFVIDALGGTFRFATGNSNHNAYEIRTPTGTIGVRGTWFDFDVDRQNHGETSIVLYEGAVDMCADGEDCVRLAEKCAVGYIPDQNAAEVFKRTDQRTYKAKANFHYLNDQSPLRRDFRFTNITRCKAPAQVAEANGECPPKYSGAWPDCVPPPCPDGWSGTYPACEPPPCPDGYSGTYPNCQPPPCPDGWSGTYPNCQPPPCPSGWSGTYPNCEPPLEPCPPDDDDDHHHPGGGWPHWPGNGGDDDDDDDHHGWPAGWPGGGGGDGKPGRGWGWGRH